MYESNKEYILEVENADTDTLDTITEALTLLMLDAMSMRKINVLCVIEMLFLKTRRVKNLQNGKLMTKGIDIALNVIKINMERIYNESTSFSYYRFI